jgi:AraC-like DNA-binding protein
MPEQNFQKWVEAAEKAQYRPDRLAKGMNVGRRQLERWTRRCFNKAPQQWLDEQRINMAVRLLKQNESIKGVGYKLGFKQPSHFSRKFKLYQGLPPRDFVASLMECGNGREGEG